MPAEHSPQNRERLALIRFHQAQARAHEEYATALAGLVEEVDAPKAPPVRGSLQKRIVGIPALAEMRGVSSREVAEIVSGDEPNCHTALKGLVEKGVVEVVERSSPQRFRLVVTHRRDRVLRMSRLISRGEWTTYGDFSIAVYDSPRMALTVARVAAHHPAFANPHRILQRGGTVSADWRDEDQGKGPEEAKRRLTDEEDWDVENDRAIPESALNWQQLRERLQAADSEEDLDQAA
jgi:alkylated DNA nucleotide flippase Atl1